MSAQTAGPAALIPEKATKMTTPQLLEVLRGHYIAETTDAHARDGGVFAPEISVNGTWGTGSRRADALYAGFTSASGRILIGHELKVSRSDWRHELTELDKADTWADACHAWYVVAPSTEVVPPEELPEGWGLMLPPKTARGKRMRIEVKAAVKQDFSPPWWAVRSFMARLDTLGHKQRLEEVTRIVQARMDEYRKRLEDTERDRRLTSDEKYQLESLRAIEEALGLNITTWRDDIANGRISVQTLIAAARLIASAKNYDLRDLPRAIRSLEEAHQRLAREVLPALAALEEATKETTP